MMPISLGMEISIMYININYNIPFSYTTIQQFIWNLANIHFKGDRCSHLVACKIMIMAFNSGTNRDKKRA